MIFVKSEQHGSVFLKCVLTVFITFQLLSPGTTVELPDFCPRGYQPLKWNFTDDSTNHLNLGFKFKYFGQEFSSLYIATNGIVTFGEGVTSTWIETTNCTRNASVPIIMTFWSDVYPRDGGEILYFATEDRSRLDELLVDVQRAYPYQKSPLTNLFVTTWKNVGFYDAATEDKNKTNSFQVVLTTDGTRSYVLFYYSKIQWPLPTYDKPATAGFIDHEGNTALLLSGACGHCVTTSVIKDSNVGVPGLWVYQVDSGITRSSMSFDITLGSSQLTKLANSLAEGNWVIKVNAQKS